MTRELAKELGYGSRHAVYMWPKDGAIPERAVLKIRYELKPEAFDASGELRPEFVSPPPQQEPDRHVA